MIYRNITMSKRDDILQQLKQYKSLSVLELELLNEIPYSTIRARISDLRKKGYDIKYENMPTGKYTINEDNPLLSHIKKNNLFNVSLSILKLSNELGILEDDVKMMVSKLFRRYEVIQLTSDNIFVKKEKENKNDKKNTTV